MTEKFFLKSLATVLSMGVGFLIPHEDSGNIARIFTTENGIKVIRTYETFARDNIYIQAIKDSTETKFTYITLTEYLDSKELEEYDRNIEESKIKKLVGW